MMPSHRSLAAGAAVLALVAAGCGSSSSSSSSSKQNTSSTTANPKAKESSPPGDIPDNQAYVAYSPPGGGYSVKVPEGWARTTQGAAVLFTDKLNSVRMESQAAKSAPTVASVTSATPSGKATTVKRKAGAAVKVVYLTNSKPDAVTGKSRTLAVESYYFFKNGKQVVLTLSGAKGADNVDPWRIVTDSFRWTA